MSEDSNEKSFSLDPNDLLSKDNFELESKQSMMQLKHRDVPGLCYPVSEVCIKNTRYLPNDNETKDEKTDTSPDQQAPLTKVTHKETSENAKILGISGNQVDKKIFSIFLLAIIGALSQALFENRSSNIVVEARSLYNDESQDKQTSTYRYSKPLTRSTGQLRSSDYLEQIQPPKLMSQTNRFKLYGDTQTEMIRPRLHVAASEESRSFDQDRDRFIAEQEKHYRGGGAASEAEDRPDKGSKTRWSQLLQPTASQDRGSYARVNQNMNTFNLDQSPTKAEEDEDDDESTSNEDSQASKVPEKRRLPNELDQGFIGSQNGLPNAQMNGNDIDDSDINDDYNAANDDSHFARKTTFKKNVPSRNQLESQASQHRGRDNQAFQMPSTRAQLGERQARIESSSNEPLRSQPDDDNLYSGASEPDLSPFSDPPNQGDSANGKISLNNQKVSNDNGENEDSEFNNFGNDDQGDSNEDEINRSSKTENPRASNVTPQNWHIDAAGSNRQNRNSYINGASVPEKSIRIVPEPYKAPISYSPRWDKEPRQVNRLPYASGNYLMASTTTTVKPQVMRPHLGSKRQSENSNVPYNPQNNPSHAGKYFIN